MHAKGTITVFYRFVLYYTTILSAQEYLVQPTSRTTNIVKVFHVLNLALKRENERLCTSFSSHCLVEVIFSRSPLSVAPFPSKI